MKVQKFNEKLRFKTNGKYWKYVNYSKGKVLRAYTRFWESTNIRLHGYYLVGHALHAVENNRKGSFLKGFFNRNILRVWIQFKSSES